MMLMKKLFFLCAMLAVGLYVQAQQLEVCTKPYGNDGSEMTVIKPTVANFLTLLAMNEEQFKTVMEANHYSLQMPRGNIISYWNGSPDNFAYAKCVNSYLYISETHEIHFAVGNDMIYPQGSLMQLYRDLRPYQVRDEEQREPKGAAPQANAPQGNAPQNGAQPTPPGFGRPDAPGAGMGRNRRGFGRGGFGRGRGGFDRPRTDTFEVKDEQSGETYIFSIASFPRFFYVTAGKKKTN